MIMLLGLPGFMIVQIYASTLRECGETVVPMVAGIVAVFTNLIGNYLLIFGKFGFPELGVAGAAIATALSRYVEAVIVAGWTHYNKEKNPYIVGLYRSLKLPLSLTKEIIIKGTPLLLNETFWSLRMANMVISPPATAKEANDVWVLSATSKRQLFASKYLKHLIAFK